MKYRVGQELYNAHIDDETLKISFTKYRIRTIRGGYVYAILLDTFTWGKLSKKRGDYGWLPYIPAFCREKVKVGDEFDRLKTTKRGALVALKKSMIISDKISVEYGAGREYSKMIEIVAKRIRRLTNAKKRN